MTNLSRGCPLSRRARPRREILAEPPGRRKRSSPGSRGPARFLGAVSGAAGANRPGLRRPPRLGRRIEDVDRPVVYLAPSGGKRTRHPPRAVAAGYAKSGDENDAVSANSSSDECPADGRRIRSAALALGVDHFGKNSETGTRGSSSKEASADLVLACLGGSLSGVVTDARLAVRKNRAGRPAGIPVLDARGGHGP